MLYRQQHFCLPLSIDHKLILVMHHKPIPIFSTYKKVQLIVVPLDLIKISVLRFGSPVCLHLSFLVHSPCPSLCQ